MKDIQTAWRMALRDLRGGVAGFRIFLFSLGLGVAAIAGVGSLTSSILSGLQANGQQILGADVDLRLIHREPSEPAQDWLAANSESVSRSLTMRTIVRATSSDARTLSELKAVDDLYPLYGQFRLEGGGDPAVALGLANDRYGVVAASELADRLDVRVGEVLRVGDAEVELRGIIAEEPDRASSGAVLLGPRLMISVDALPATNLIQPGSMIFRHYRVKLPPGADLAGFVSTLQDRFPDEGWRVRDSRRGAPGVESFIERLRVFLILVGLTALLVGGVGVGNAVKAHLDTKRRSIAILKCLGATGGDITRIFMIQILVLGTVGIVAGLIVGGLVPFIVGSLMAQVLPVAPEANLFAVPLLLATLYGILITLTFALWPLGSARRTSAASLFRAMLGDGGERPPRSFIIGTVLSLAGLAGLTLASSDQPEFAAYFVLGAAGCFAVLWLAAQGVMRAAARVKGPRSSTFRMALANLHRPGAPTVSVMISLGLGVTLLAAVALIEGNVKGQVDRRVAEEAPAFFFIDIQPHQLDPFLATANGIDGVSNVQTVPTLRGRITRLKGEVPDESKVDPGEAWVLRGDRGLTYAANPPENSPIVEGEWWPADYQGEPLISFEKEAAVGLGLEIGDTITINVLGRDITARIASLREIDWGTFAINYLFIFDPATLAGAPHTHLATAHAEGAAEQQLYRAVTDQFANVSAIRVKEAMTLFDKILGQVATAIRAASGVTLFAGMLVLAGAIAAGHRRRVRESVVLKVIGATRGQILRINAAEFAVLGCVTAIVAAVAGSAAGWGVITFVMQGEFTILPARLAVVIFGAIILTTLLGLLGAWRALGRKPAAELRVE